MSAPQRPSRIEIDLQALKRNLGRIRSLLKPSARLMAVVKADAYGHGAPKISLTAEEARVDYLGVALLEEADEIRKAGVRLPIAILYPETIERSVEAVSRGYHISVSSPAEIENIRKAIGNRNYPIRYFIKINTGMNRYGMEPESGKVEDIVGKASSYGGLLGFNTNIADPSMNRKDLSKRQMDRFFEFMKNAMSYSQNGLMFSYEASGSLWENGAADGSLVRVGLLMYGIAPDRKDRLELEPVMSVKSRIAEIHNLRKGDGVGYGFSHVADRRSRVAVIPMGYADGYPWALSNKGSVIIRGKLAPIIGRICMDAFMADITDVENSLPGDEVTIMGTQDRASIDANMLGEWAGSFAYEIVSGWSKRMPRIYI